MKNLALIFATFVLCSCASDPGISPAPQATIQEVADYGCPPPDNYQELIKTFLEEKLFDSESARYKFNEPKKACVETFTPETYSMKVFFQLTIAKVYCWAVPVRVNAKNRYGAYVGWQDRVFFFKDGKLASLDVSSYKILEH